MSTLLDEVALFIDWENIRYSMLNLHGQEPDPIKMRRPGRIARIATAASTTFAA